MSSTVYRQRMDPIKTTFQKFLINRFKLYGWVIKNKQTMEQGEIRPELAKEISALRVLASLVHGVLTLFVGI